MNYFVQVVHQTFEEKYQMYMKLPKKELAKMLAARDEYDDINSSAHECKQWYYTVSG